MTKASDIKSVLSEFAIAAIECDYLYSKSALFLSKYNALEDKAVDQIIKLFTAEGQLPVCFVSRETGKT